MAIKGDIFRKILSFIGEMSESQRCILRDECSKKLPPAKNKTYKCGNTNAKLKENWDKQRKLPEGGTDQFHNPHG